MNLVTAGSGEKRGITEEDLLAAFADDEARGEYIILSNEDGSSFKPWARASVRTPSNTSRASGAART